MNIEHSSTAENKPALTALSAMTPEQRAAFEPLTVDGLPVTRGGLVWNDEAQMCVWNADAVTVEYKAINQGDKNDHTA